ncbi:pyridine nucleotide-disulfide oxidoreductase domain-containing protein [Toxoplasma gondii CAST]|uniref:Pyridine nucleotide-disulfide oxidoreductase domain-containing protein n=1 Tax=Toxoplasma gondii CAST TaxID=943122 RepID=A0A3R7YMY3_TOXGO|nr:pyridine nucleotide-disulfide oxidoreductase domain-containing protein [Toxoplasma gondii CAST]
MASLRSQAWRRVAQRAFSHLSSSSPLFSSGLQGLPAAVSVSPTQTREHKSERMFWTKGLCAAALAAGAVSVAVGEGNSRTEGRKLGGSPVFSRAFGRCPRVAACAEKRTATDLGAAEDFQRGGLYELAVNGGKDKVLLSRTADGTFYCTGASCSHYSASLSKGVLTAKRTVTCPLHDAEFDLETGKCVNGPALSAIPTYPVEIKDGRVVAQIPDEVPVRARGVYAKEKRGQNTETFVLLGGGAAAATAAETLRAEGFDGRIVMICEESVPPYDRPVLTKNLNAKLDNILLRPLKALQEDLGVQVLLNSRAVGVDLKTKTVRLEGNAPDVKFDKLLLCTGSEARRLTGLPNGTARGIFTVRGKNDLQELSAFLEENKKFNSDPRVAIIGSSFVGVELAAAFHRRGCKNVTVIGQETVPFERVLGSRVGGSIKQLICSKGVRFYPQSKVVGFTSSRDRVTGVELASGEIIQADVVIVGIGSVPATKFLADQSEFALARDGAIVTDPLLRLPANPDVFVAGDIAAYPYVKTGEQIRVEHWAVAMQQGRVAALNMLGHHVPFTQIPFFWSMIFGKGMRFAGWIGSGFDEVIIEGDIDKQQFVAYYVKDDRVTAVCTMGRDPVAVAAVELLEQNLMPSPGELRQGLKNSQDVLAIAKETAATKTVKRLV